MSWKEFFKPNISKVILILILITVGYLNFPIAVSALIPSNKPYCLGLQAETLHPNFLTYILLPLSPILFGKICNFHLLKLIHLPYHYIISCLIIFIYNKIENKGKNKSGKLRKKCA